MPNEQDFDNTDGPHVSSHQVKPSPSVIVVSGNDSSIPAWFYVVFTVVVLIFIAMTYVVTVTLLAKSQGGMPNAVITPSPTLRSKDESTLPHNSPAVSSAAGSFVQMEKQLTESEVYKTKAEIKSQNVSAINQALTELDKDMGFTPR